MTANPPNTYSRPPPPSISAIKPIFHCIQPTYSYQVQASTLVQSLYSIDFISTDFKPDANNLSGNVLPGFESLAENILEFVHYTYALEGFLVRFRPKQLPPDKHSHSGEIDLTSSPQPTHQQQQQQQQHLQMVQDQRQQCAAFVNYLTPSATTLSNHINEIRSTSNQHLPPNTDVKAVPNQYYQQYYFASQTQDQSSHARNRYNAFSSYFSNFPTYIHANSTNIQGVPIQTSIKLLTEHIVSHFLSLPRPPNAPKSRPSLRTTLLYYTTWRFEYVYHSILTRLCALNNNISINPHLTLNPTAPTATPLSLPDHVEIPHDISPPFHYSTLFTPLNLSTIPPDPNRPLTRHHPPFLQRNTLELRKQYLVQHRDSISNQAISSLFLFFSRYILDYHLSSASKDISSLPTQLSKLLLSFVTHTQLTPPLWYVFPFQYPGFTSHRNVHSEANNPTATQQRDSDCQFSFDDYLHPTAPVRSISDLITNTRDGINPLIYNNINAQDLKVNLTTPFNKYTLYLAETQPIPDHIDLSTPTPTSPTTQTDSQIPIKSTVPQVVHNIDQFQLAIIFLFHFSREHAGEYRREFEAYNATTNRLKLTNNTQIDLTGQDPSNSHQLRLTKNAAVTAIRFTSNPLETNHYDSQRDDNNSNNNNNNIRELITSNHFIAGDYILDMRQEGGHEDQTIDIDFEKMNTNVDISDQNTEILAHAGPTTKKGRRASTGAKTQSTTTPHAGKKRSSISPNAVPGNSPSGDPFSPTDRVVNGNGKPASTTTTSKKNSIHSFLSPHKPTTSASTINTPFDELFDTDFPASPLSTPQHASLKKTTRTGLKPDHKAQTTASTQSKRLSTRTSILSNTINMTKHDRVSDDIDLLDDLNDGAEFELSLDSKGSVLRMADAPLNAISLITPIKQPTTASHPVSKGDYPNQMGDNDLDQRFSQDTDDDDNDDDDDALFSPSATTKSSKSRPIRIPNNHPPSSTLNAPVAQNPDQIPGGAALQRHDAKSDQSPQFSPIHSQDSDPFASQFSQQVQTDLDTSHISIGNGREKKDPPLLTKDAAKKLTPHSKKSDTSTPTKPTAKQKKKEEDMGKNRSIMDYFTPGKRSDVPSQSNQSFQPQEQQDMATITATTNDDADASILNNKQPLDDLVQLPPATPSSSHLHSEFTSTANGAATSLKKRKIPPQPAPQPFTEDDEIELIPQDPSMGFDDVENPAQSQPNGPSQPALLPNKPSDVSFSSPTVKRQRNTMTNATEIHRHESMILLDSDDDKATNAEPITPQVPPSSTSTLQRSKAVRVGPTRNSLLETNAKVNQRLFDDSEVELLQFSQGSQPNLPSSSNLKHFSPLKSAPVDIEALQLSTTSLSILNNTTYDSMLSDPASFTSTGLTGFPHLPVSTTIPIFPGQTTYLPSTTHTTDNFSSSSTDSTDSNHSTRTPLLKAPPTNQHSNRSQAVLQSQGVYPVSTPGTQGLSQVFGTLSTATDPINNDFIQLKFDNVGGIYHFSSPQAADLNHTNEIDVNTDIPSKSILARFIHSFSSNQPPSNTIQSNMTYESYIQLFDSIISLSQSSLVTNQLPKDQRTMPESTNANPHFPTLRESNKTFSATLAPFHTTSLMQLLPVVSISATNLIQPPTAHQFLTNPFKLPPSARRRHCPSPLPLPISISSVCSASSKPYDQDSLSYRQSYFNDFHPKRGQNRFTIFCLADGHGEGGTAVSNTITQTLPQFLESQIYQLVRELNNNTFHDTSRHHHHSRTPGIPSYVQPSASQNLAFIIPIAITRALDQVQRLLLQTVHDQISNLNAVFAQAMGKLQTAIPPTIMKDLQALKPSFSQATQLLNKDTINVPHQSTVHFSPTSLLPLSAQFLPAIPHSLHAAQVTTPLPSTPKACKKANHIQPASNTWQHSYDVTKPSDNNPKTSQQYHQYSKSITQSVDCGSTVVVVVVDNDDTFYRCAVHVSQIDGTSRCCPNAVLYRHMHVAVVGDSTAVVYQQQSYFPQYASNHVTEVNRTPTGLNTMTDRLSNAVEIDDVKNDSINFRSHSLVKTKSTASADSLSTQASEASLKPQRTTAMVPQNSNTPVLSLITMSTPPLHLSKTGSLTQFHSMRKTDTPVLHPTSSSGRLTHSCSMDFSYLDDDNAAIDVDLKATSIRTALEFFVLYHIPELLELTNFVDFHLDIDSLEQLCHTATIINHPMIRDPRQVTLHPTTSRDAAYSNSPCCGNLADIASSVSTLPTTLPLSDESMQYHRTDIVSGHHIPQPPSTLTHQFSTISSPSVNYSLLCSGLKRLRSNIQFSNFSLTDPPLPKRTDDDRSQTPPTSPALSQFQDTLSRLVVKRGKLSAFHTMSWKLFPHLSLQPPRPIQLSPHTHNHNRHYDSPLHPIFSNSNEHDATTCHLEWSRLQRLRTSIYHRSCDCYRHTQPIFFHSNSTRNQSSEELDDSSSIFNLAKAKQPLPFQQPKLRFFNNSAATTTDFSHQQSFDNISHPSLRNHVQPHHHMIHHAQCPLSYILYYQNSETASNQHQFAFTTDSHQVNPPGHWAGFIDVVFSPYPTFSAQDSYPPTTSLPQSPSSPVFDAQQTFSLGSQQTPAQSNTNSPHYQPPPTNYTPQLPCDCIPIYQQQFTTSRYVTAFSILIQHLTAQIESDHCEALLSYADQLSSRVYHDHTEDEDNLISASQMTESSFASRSSRESRDTKLKRGEQGDSQTPSVTQNITDICINFLHDPVTPLLSQVLLPNEPKPSEPTFTTTPFHIHTLFSLITSKQPSNIVAPLASSHNAHSPPSPPSLLSTLSHARLNNGFYAMYPFLWPFLFFPTLPEWLYYFILDHGVVYYPYTFTITPSSLLRQSTENLFGRFPATLNAALHTHLIQTQHQEAYNTALHSPIASLSTMGDITATPIKVLIEPSTNLDGASPPTISRQYQVYCPDTRSDPDPKIQHGFTTLILLPPMSSATSLYQNQLNDALTALSSALHRLPESNQFPTPANLTNLHPVPSNEIWSFANGTSPNTVLTKFPSYRPTQSSIRSSLGYLDQSLIRSLKLALVTSRSLGHYYISSKLHQNNLNSPSSLSHLWHTQVYPKFIPYMSHNHPTLTTLQLAPQVQKDIQSTLAFDRKTDLDLFDDPVNPVQFHLSSIQYRSGVQCSNHNQHLRLNHPKSHLFPHITPFSLFQQINRPKPLYTNSQLLCNASTRALKVSYGNLNNPIPQSFHQRPSLNKHIETYSNYHKKSNQRGSIPPTQNSSPINPTTQSLSLSPTQLHHPSLYPLLSPKNIIPTQWLSQHNFFCTHHTLFHTHYTQALLFATLLSNVHHFSPNEQFSTPTQAQIGFIFALSEAIAGGIDFRPSLSSFYSNCNNTTLISLQSDGVTNALTSEGTSLALNQPATQHNPDRRPLVAHVSSQHHAILDSIYANNSIKAFPAQFLPAHPTPSIVSGSNQAFQNLSVLLALHSLGNVVTPSHGNDTTHDVFRSIYHEPFGVPESNLSTSATIDVELLPAPQHHRRDSAQHPSTPSAPTSVIPSEATVSGTIPICSINPTYITSHLQKELDSHSHTLPDDGQCANCSYPVQTCLCLINQHSYDTSLTCSDCIRDGSIAAEAFLQSEVQLDDSANNPPIPSSSISNLSTIIPVPQHAPHSSKTRKNCMVSNPTLATLPTTSITPSPIDIYPTPVNPYTNTSYLTLTPSHHLSSLLQTHNSSNVTAPFFHYGWLLCDQFGYSIVILDPPQTDETMPTRAPFDCTPSFSPNSNETTLSAIPIPQIDMPMANVKSIETISELPNQLYPIQPYHVKSNTYKIKYQLDRYEGASVLPQTIHTHEVCNPVYHFHVSSPETSSPPLTSNSPPADHFDHLALTRIVVISTESHGALALTAISSQSWKTTNSGDNISVIMASIPPQK